MVINLREKIAEKVNGVHGTALTQYKKKVTMKQQWHNYIIEMKGKKKTCQNHYYFINLRITMWNGFMEHLQTQIDATSIYLK